jgi:hypothetical protein
MVVVVVAVVVVAAVIKTSIQHTRRAPVRTQHSTLIHDRSRDRAHEVPTKVRAVRKHALLQDRSNVRQQQRPAELAPILHREEVQQEHAALPTNHLQSLPVLFVRRDEEPVVRPRWIQHG